MKKFFCAIFSVFLLVLSCFSAELPVLQDEIKFPDAVIECGKYHIIKFPPMPARRGKRAVMRFELVAKTPARGGCGFSATVSVNSYTLTRWTSDKRERMIGRAGTLKLKGHGNRDFNIFRDLMLLVMFAPDAVAGNSMSQDGLGATYMVEISDMLYKDAFNTATFHNLRQPVPGGKAELILTNAAVGWLDMP